MWAARAVQLAEDKDPSNLVRRPVRGGGHNYTVDEAANPIAGGTDAIEPVESNGFVGWGGKIEWLTKCLLRAQAFRRGGVLQRIWLALLLSGVRRCGNWQDRDPCFQPGTSTGSVRGTGKGAVEGQCPWPSGPSAPRSHCNLLRAPAGDPSFAEGVPGPA